MGILVRIVHHCFLLNALFGDWTIDVDGALGARRCGQGRDFQRVQSAACVAVGGFGQMAQGRFVCLDFQMAQAALLVRQRALQKQVKFFLGQRAQLENLRARNQRRVDKKEWIMRRRANQADNSVFNIRQQHVLLGFVKPMDFVDKEDGRLTRIFEPVGGASQHPAHVGHVGFHAAQALEFAFGVARDDLGHRRLACARRPVENQRLNAVGFDGAAQELSRAEDMSLADELLEGAGSHAGSQRSGPKRSALRLGGLWGLDCGSRKKVVPRHKGKLTCHA